MFLNLEDELYEMVIILKYYYSIMIVIIIEAYLFLSIAKEMISYLLLSSKLLNYKMDVY